MTDLADEALKRTERAALISRAITQNIVTEGSPNQPNNQSNPDLDQSRYTVEPSIGQGCSGLPDGEAA